MYKNMYTRRKEELIKDRKIDSNNRKVIAKFLEFEEYKLKRKQGLSEVDESSYKTLYFYISRLRNLNKWFNNKDWKKLTEKEIKTVIDNLEDGKIVNLYGRRYSDRSIYYQMIQGKLFTLVGKNHIARDILEEFSIRGREYKDNVRYIEEDSFRKIVDCAPKPIQKCLLWLAWDIGENINALLQLEKKDFKKQVNTDTNEPEYLVILSKEKLKRSRTPRAEITNYKETVRYLDIALENLSISDKNVTNKYMKETKKLSELHDENKVFKFGWKAAENILKRAVEKAGVRCLPAGEQVTWKDLRSSMACDLLRKGWSSDEVNCRLGHKPSSRIIDRYINYLALDRSKPKKKVYESNLRKIEEDFEKQKEVNKLQGLRIETLKKEQEDINKVMENKNEVITKLQEQVKQMAISSEKEMKEIRKLIKVSKK